MNLTDKIFIAGASGLVGSAIVRKLVKEKYTNLIIPTRLDLDLTDQVKVNEFFKQVKPDYVIDAAAKVGGLQYNNNNPADFIYDNLMIQTNLIHNCYIHKVKKLLFLGSVCIYPKFCELPIKEEYLLSGKPEPTNDNYSIAKIAGIKMCQSYSKQYNCNFISAMPINVYGINDRFDIEQGHVIPSLILKFLDAKINKHPYVECWGDGTPTREFIFSDDLADACIFLLKNYNNSDIINIGIENEISIKDLAELIKKLTNYTGKIIWNTSKPNGVMRRKVCNKKLYELGWRPSVSLTKGLATTIEWYLNTKGKIL